MMPPTAVPRVTVIIPTFNRAHFLAQAIASVLAQTFSDFEVIVVDDGSTDDTAVVATAFQDDRVVYVRQQNAGRSAARNRGLALARGEFIAFLDDDDLYLPHKLQEQVSFLDQQLEVDIVVSDSDIIDASGKTIDTWRRWEQHPDLTLDSCVLACPISTCTVLLRKVALERIDHWFDADLDRAEDTDFYLRLFAAGALARWLPIIVSARRLHAGDSQNSGAKYGAAYLTMLDNLFSQPRLPENLEARRNEIYAAHLINGALLALHDGQVNMAADYVAQALEKMPQWSQGGLPELSLRLAAFTETRWCDEPLAFIDTFFEKLPPSAYGGRRRSLRNSTLSALFMGRVFSLKNRGEPVLISDWIRGVSYNPRWLTNIGVWSILFDPVRRRIKDFHGLSPA